MRSLTVISAAALLGSTLVAGCGQTSEPVADQTATPMQTQEETITDITPEQDAFLADLLATPLPETEATARIEAAGYTWRLGTIDGEPQAVTMDYRIDRLTLTTQDGLVIDATWG